MEVGDRIDRYVIERVLGEGGMATVYLARHDTLRSLHALKVLRIDVPSIKQRLLTEGRVQAALRHPNIVAVTDVIDRKSVCALVMEYVEGPSLDAWIDDPDIPLVLEERLQIFRGIAMGVAAAHHAGLVHRDLKPDNVLLAKTNSGLMPKVTDFGLVKVEESNQTRSGMLMGTAEYMAPEQVRDAARVDARADIWSLGVLLYELVSDSQPFHAQEVLDVYNQIAAAEYPPVQEMNPDVPDDVADVIDAMLVLDPTERPSADELLEWLFPDQPVVRHHSSVEHDQLLASLPPTQDDDPRNLTAQEIDTILKVSKAVSSPAPGRLAGVAIVGGAVLGTLLFTLIGIGAFVMLRPTADPKPTAPTTRMVELSANLPFTQLEIDGRSAPYNRNRAELQLTLGSHVIWAEAGSCTTADKGCGDGCPPGCASRVIELEVTEGEGPLKQPLDLVMKQPEPEPAPEPQPEPAPTPAPVIAPVPAPPPTPAAPKQGKLVTGQAYASWLKGHPQWAREAAVEGGRADARYLRDWNPDPPAGALTQVPWAAAAAYCADRGGLAALDDPPLTWKPGVMQEWRVADGKPAWRRSDGVTSTANPGNKSFSFTGARCKR